MSYSSEYRRGYESALGALADDQCPLKLYAPAAGGRDDFDHGWCRAIEEARPELFDEMGNMR